MENKKIKIHKIKIIAITMLFFCLSINFAGCGIRASSYTEEEHIQRISERIKDRDTNWGYPEGETYADFEVYPLYDANEELKYFLVEFEPYGFVFVCLIEEKPGILSCLGASTSMYKLSNVYGINYTWSPYIKDETNSQPSPDSDKSWILNENGERIFNNKSPYYITGNIEEKKYLLVGNSHSDFICAIKKDGEFINLVSGKVFDSQSLNEQSTMYIAFIAKANFDL